MSLHWDTLSWFRVIQSLILFINPASLVKKQKYKLNSRWFDLTWTRTHYLQDSRWACYPLHHRLEPTIYKTQGEHAIHYITWPDLTWTRTHYLQLKVSMLSITSPDLTWTRTHYLQDFKVSMLSITSPTRTHYLQDFKVSMLSITSPPRTHYLQDSRWACYPLHHQCR
jgi:hypothetical protein